MDYGLWARVDLNPLSDDTLSTELPLRQTIQLLIKRLLRGIHITTLITRIRPTRDLRNLRLSSVSMYERDTE
jgi:hypothetical protein